MATSYQLATGSAIWPQDFIQLTQSQGYNMIKYPSTHLYHVCGPHSHPLLWDNAKCNGVVWKGKLLPPLASGVRRRWSCMCVARLYLESWNYTREMVGVSRKENHHWAEASSVFREAMRSINFSNMMSKTMRNTCAREWQLFLENGWNQPSHLFLLLKWLHVFPELSLAARMLTNGFTYSSRSWSTSAFFENEEREIWESLVTDSTFSPGKLTWAAGEPAFLAVPTMQSQRRLAFFLTSFTLLVTYTVCE